MPRKTTTQGTLLDLDAQLRTAACVPAIRVAVADWQAGGCQGTTDTTRELLNFWFHQDHVLANRQRFSFHPAQREAIETLIYIYEVAKVRTRKELLEKYAFNTKDLRVPPYDDFARYCVKMATGSGKTFVMGLSVVWQFANYLRGEPGYANTFLVLAPNVIVFDRLKSDFGNGAIFQALPFIPPYLKWLWDMAYYLRGDPERAYTSGALYLTNIQQFYERGPSPVAEPAPMTGVLGSLPPSQKLETNDFVERIAAREGLTMVVNDEAHHTHEEDSEWNKLIRRLHGQRPLAAQLDFSATPRYTKGGLFAWTVYDYPLKRAIEDQIVKRPVKGIAQIEEARSDIASVRYSGYLAAAVARWKEYREQLAPLGKKPILFVMMNSTDAREVDHQTSGVNAIVSVLMLREGWDVQNVTVIVGLRPYTAKANILPEQTIGRGLRLMFRHQPGTYTERVDIIGNRAFMEFVEDLEKLEDLEFDTFQLGSDKPHILTIRPVEAKSGFDIGLPEISPVLDRKKSLADEIAAIDVMQFDINQLPLRAKEIEEAKKFIYEGRDILTDEKLLHREYAIPQAQTAEEVIGYYARRVAQNVKLPSQFAALAPKIREFFAHKAFGQTVDLADPVVINALGSNLASYVVTREFEKALLKVVVEEKQPELMAPSRWLSTTQAFPTSRQVLEAQKTVFNYTPYDNKYEQAFIKFLDQATDIKAFAKLPEQFGFYIQYINSLANIRHYYPDFIVVDQAGGHWLVETKGREDLEVPLKDQAATLWCQNASELTDTRWQYLKVQQKVFEELRPDNLADLLTVTKVGGVF